MVLESLNGTFGFVTAMDVCRSELEIYIFFIHESFKDSGGFVVKAL